MEYTVEDAAKTTATMLAIMQVRMMIQEAAMEIIEEVVMQTTEAMSTPVKNWSSKLLLAKIMTSLTNVNELKLTFIDLLRGELSLKKELCEADTN